MCMGCTGINIGEGFCLMFGEQCHTFGFWVDLTMAILFILIMQQRVVPRNYYYLLIF